MKAWAIFALVCLMAPDARADDDELYTCRAVAPSMTIQVEFKGDPGVRDLVTWLMGSPARA